MDPDQRKFIHELASCYGLESKSQNKMEVKEVGEPTVNLRRYVVVTVKKDFWETVGASLPSTTLCEVARRQLERAKSGWADWGCVVKIYDLTPAVKTEHLVAFLSPFEGEYTLKWVDDHSALAFFDDPAKAAAAVQSLGKGMMFKVKKVESDDDIKKKEALININNDIKELDSRTGNINISATFKDAPKATDWLKERAVMREGGLLGQNPMLQRKEKAKQSELSSKMKEKDLKQLKEWRAPVSNPWSLLSTAPNPDVKDSNITATGEQITAATSLPGEDRDSWLSLVDDDDNNDKNITNTGGDSPNKNNKSNMWACTACTYLNPWTVKVCDMCSTPYMGKK